MTSKPVRPREGLVIYRWLMILGSFAPLFIILAIKGSPLVTDKKTNADIPLLPQEYYLIGCLVLAIIPTFIIWLRIRRAIKINDHRTIIAGQVTDSREHLLVYLFALILPLYQNTYSGFRDVWAAIALLVFVFFVLYHLSLHYMNLAFALFGYRVYTVKSKDQTNPFTGQCPFVVLSKRHNIPAETELHVYRISDTVYIEYKDHV